jgi:hypothetical protein
MRPPLEEALLTLINLVAGVSLLADFTASCTPARQPGVLSDTPLPTPVADTFFTGCAFLDQNANERVDRDDTVLEDMTFVITLSGGAGFAASTADTGCATEAIPAPLETGAWPVVSQMEMPQPSAFARVGDLEIMLAYPDTRADSLFSPR